MIARFISGAKNDECFERGRFFAKNKVSKLGSRLGRGPGGLPGAILEAPRGSPERPGSAGRAPGAPREAQSDPQEPQNEPQEGLNEPKEAPNETPEGQSELRMVPGGFRKRFCKDFRGMYK